VQSGLALFGRAYPGLSTAPKLPPPAVLSRYTEALLERIQALCSPPAVGCVTGQKRMAQHLVN
jgi:hypothetical protein